MTCYFLLASSPLDSDPIRVEVWPDVPDVGDLIRIGTTTYQVDSRRWDVDTRRVYVRLDVVTP